MATRALILCADEKAVHAIAQILDELEVSFEHSSETPFTLKRLATQRFDLLVVDCDNAQNATQVFNSARASSFNKNSIAVAIVEGKAGVPNAFRLGASLVLTKPVSLEQSRNTLRTGIGMTKKDAPDTRVPAAPAPAVTAPTATAPTISAPVSATAPAPRAVTAPVLAPVAAKPAAVPSPAAPSPAVPPPAAQNPLPAQDIVAKPVAAAPMAEKSPLVPKAVSPPALPTPDVKKELKPASTTAPGPKAKPAAGSPLLVKAAAAGATASAGKSEVKLAPISLKQDTTRASAKKTADEKLSSPLRVEDPLADVEHSLDPMKEHGVPSFGGRGKQVFADAEETRERKAGKGFLIAVLLLLVLGGGAYAAWMTQPPLRDAVLAQYDKAQDRIAEWRGQPRAAAAEKPQPAAPAPAVVPPAPPSTNLADASAAGNIGPNTAPTTGSTAPATSATTQPSLQAATQDTTHSAANAALVPASLPPTAAPKKASDLIDVPEDFADDQVVHRVHPVYPKQARAKRLHGTVVLQAIVNKQGKVDALQLISGDPVLGQAAQNAVKQWRYKPYFHDGEAVDFQTRVSVDFKLP